MNNIEETCIDTDGQSIAPNQLKKTTKKKKKKKSSPYSVRNNSNLKAFSALEKNVCGYLFGKLI